MKGDEMTRLRAKIVESPSGCWEWTAATYPSGYGAFMSRRLDGRWTVIPAHKRT